MKISTRGRYAVRVLLDLSEHDRGEYVPLSDIAKRQEISEKYLESIVSLLVKNGFLTALRGKGGGYKLTKEPGEYSIGSILKITEGSFATVACLENDNNQCGRIAHCKTLDLWKGLQKVIEDYFESITIQDLLDKSTETDNYVI